jgi:hypothetical protein
MVGQEGYVEHVFDETINASKKTEMWMIARRSVVSILVLHIIEINFMSASFLLDCQFLFSFSFPDTSPK